MQQVIRNLKVCASLVLCFTLCGGAASAATTSNFNVSDSSHYDAPDNPTTWMPEITYSYDLTISNSGSYVNEVVLHAWQHSSTRDCNCDFILDPALGGPGTGSLTFVNNVYTEEHTFLRPDKTYTCAAYNIGVDDQGQPFMVPTSEQDVYVQQDPGLAKNHQLPVHVAQYRVPQKHVDKVAMATKRRV